ncbi:SusC/RagA family TonB-linked outer membrane protein [Parapedobacter koreensis]|uniref:TonB-linked outer membrane protein, SusC/RagA family n=1 Tax=Parapedobacter koreensis TaxID=332977 RepID=A0A1H7JSZ0_9SPHI|nr:TonB-dependent receptor [Parapedobacter koreensis]SEK77446.1 TonB-linked outer membrane protein, SusC/RagA family [Parapedobacter koreensis]
MISVYKPGLRRQRGKAIKAACLSLLLFFYSVYTMAQGGGVGISGIVVDEGGVALSGVSIRSSVGTASTSTDDGGRFTIRVPASSALIFSYVGYATQEIKVGEADQQLTVTLVGEASALDEVIVVGYGVQRKEAVTGSVATIGGDQMRDVPSANISQALQGRLPGVQLSQTSSQPGATTQIRIRGTRSLNASNDPLVVLDGIPFAGSIGDINPNDIKSLDILKDASATAIYGSRGANGVILVTTNKGQSGQAARVSYNSFQGFKTIFSKYPMMNGPEFAALRAAAGQYQNGLDESDDVNTDWQDLFYRTGNTISQDVGVSAGTEKGNYNFGGGYFQDEGVVPTQKYSRISLRGTVDQQLGDYFRVGFTTNNNYNMTEGSQVGLYAALSMSPIANPYNEDGTWKRTIRMPLDEPWTATREIIEGVQDQWLNETRAYATYNSVYGEVSVPWVEGLKYRINLGLDYRQSNGGAYTGQGINATNPTTPSSASISNQHTYHWVVENLLTYDRTFAEKHNINVTALYSSEQNKFNQSGIAARDIPADAFQFYNLGQATGEITIDPNGQIYELWGLMSWMGRVMYSYDDRYMLSATLRSDGSSRLASGHKWHTYPAISAGWNIGREAFMQDVSFVDMLKLRVGYGQTSNQAIAPYATLGRLNTRPYNFGSDNYAVGYYVSQLPNAGLGWEYSETWNYGLDFSILNSRLSGTLEYYVTNTNDVLLNVNLPNTAGVGSYTANIGETQNKGLELSLNGVILDDHNGWTWEAGINVYGNRNKLVALASGQDRDEGNWWFVGHPIDVVFDYEYTGLWQEGDPYLDILEPGGNVGMVKVKYTGDYNDDGTPARAIGLADRQIINLQPDFQGGFNTRVAYKNIDLSAVGMFQRGGTLISTLHTASGYLNMLSGRRNNVRVDYWTPENTDARYPMPGGIISGDNPKYGSTLGYFDASHLKIRTLSLGYNFDGSDWVQRAGIDRLRFYFTVQNPFVLFSPYNRETGLDPETNSYADENAAVTNTYRPRLLTIGTNSPATRSYLFGINLVF